MTYLAATCPRYRHASKEPAAVFLETARSFLDGVPWVFREPPQRGDKRGVDARTAALRLLALGRDAADYGSCAGSGGDGGGI